MVICLETLEHTMYPRRVINEIKRVAKKNATFFLSMPNEYNFLQRIYYLFGIKTLVDEPFEVVEKHLHIHKPRVKDIVNFFSEYFMIDDVDYVWESRHRNILDRLFQSLARIKPSMFCRLVSVKARNKE